MNRNCLKNIRKSDSMEAFMQGGYRTIQITFNKSIPEENLPKELKVYVTSFLLSVGKTSDMLTLCHCGVSSRDDHATLFLRCT